jgi:hypothetical protein
MNELEKRIQEEIKTAMKAGQGIRTATLRMVSAALKNERIHVRRDLSEMETVQVLKRNVKSRRESVDAFRQAGREEMAEKEEQEIRIIEEYLPRQLSPEETKQAMADLIRELGVESPRQIGLLMSEFMKRYRNVADGKLAQQAARSILS